MVRRATGAAPRRHRRRGLTAPHRARPRSTRWGATPSPRRLPLWRLVLELCTGFDTPPRLRLGAGILGGMVPDFLESIGQEVGRVWPLIIAAGAAVSLMAPLRRWMERHTIELAEAAAARERDEMAHATLDTKLDTIVTMLGRHDASLTTLWETAPEALYIAGVDGRLLDCNRAYLRVWGFHSKHEARGDDWLHLLDDGEAELARERVARVFSEPQVWTFDYTVDGRRIRITGHPFADDDGHFAGYVGAVLDVTDD